MTTTEGSSRAAPWRPDRSALVASVLALALFATGVGPRPAGPSWDWVYDVLLYNAVYLGGIVVCVAAGRRRRDRAGWALATALLLTVTANLTYSLVIARMPEEPYPSLADAFYLAAYPAQYVALLMVIRARVPRFHASMWLDGLIGALGASGLAIAVLLAPSLRLTGGDTAAAAVGLAYPVADVLMLALLVAVGGILGIRRDPALVLLGAGFAANLVGDIVFLDLLSRGVYVEGGPLDLAWLGGVVLMSAALRAAPVPARLPAAPSGQHARLGWRLLAVPMVCNLGSLLLLGMGWGDDYPDVAAWCAVGCVVAALARTGVTFHEVRAFHEVRTQALTDELTGLPNRRALLKRAQTLTTPPVAPAALLLLDLDGFKEVNDSLGHHAGDELLRALAARIERVVPSTALAARLGGDEFAVLLPGVEIDEAQLCAELVRRSVLEPVTVEGVRLHVGVSIGIASSPVPAATVEELLRCADVAMYAAKAAGDGVRTYLPDPASGTGDRLRTMDELRTALETGQLLVHLQPQVHLADGRVVGAEALVRWQHPTRGLLSPADLLPAAEQAGLLRPLAEVVLDLALSAAARWWRDHRVTVAVNLAAANVTDLDLPARIAERLAFHGLPAQALVLELVEDTLMTDPDRGRAVLSRLREGGSRTSIDDYGTGYSSLAYLRHLDADELKLDRSLVQDVGTDAAAAAIVRHTVALAHDLGLVLVAEGVEDPAVVDVLRDLGCDVGQGYAIARPMPVEEFLVWLERPRVDPVPLLAPGGQHPQP